MSKKKELTGEAQKIADLLNYDINSGNSNGGVEYSSEAQKVANLLGNDLINQISASQKKYKIEELSPEELKRKNVEDFRQAEIKEQQSREIYDTRPEYAGLNKEEKEYLVKKEKEGKLVGEDLARAAWTMAGNDPMQKKVVEKDAKGNKLYSDLGELYKKGEEKGFFSSVLTDIELSKYSGGNYYMKDRGDGTLVPVPLAYNEKPEAKNVKDAQVFSSLDDDAYGDSRFVDIAKKAWNIIPAVAQGFVSIPEVAQGLITGKTGRGYEVAKDVLEAAKFKTSQEFQKGIIDTQKIDEFSDFLSKDVYDLSPDKIINTVVNVASSLGEFAVTRKFVPIGGKAGTFAAGTAMNIKEPLQAAEDAGVEGRAKYAVAATYALAASGLETALGIEGKIFDDAATTAKKQMINKIIKDNVEVVGGKLTKESVENLYKETLKEVPSFYAKYLKNTVGEVTEEVAQNMIQNATQEIHDIVMKDDPEAAKFNTKFWSPEALAEYMNSAFGGLIGGVAGSRFIKDKQSQTAYDAIKDGKENELKVQLVSGLKEGRLTQDDYERAIFKIDSYKSYYDATKDRNVTDEERRKIFDLTYEKENTKSGIERLKQNNPGGINDELIATKEQQISDYSQQIKDIWASSEARTSEAPVEEAKAEAPAWKTSMDEFAKRVHNSDKYPSQKITTKDDAITALGLTPELNELSKGISIDFKAPHLPEGLGIRVRKGILYEPITIKQEGKDLTEERQLPTYLFEDKDGENWMLAVGQKTDVDAPDVTYLIKLDNEGNYEGHQEFKYETAKKNELTFDNLKDVFDEFNLKPVSTSNDAKAFTPPQAEFEEMEEVEYEDVIPAKEYEESGQFKEVYETVKGGLNRAKLKILPNGTVGLDIEGTDVPFASQRYLNKESLPQGDVQVVLETVENVDGKYGRGVVVKTLEGERLGYIRRAGKAKGKINLGKVSIDEDIVVDIPEMSDIAKEKIQQIEKDQEKYEFIQDELGRRYVDKNTREPYTSVTKYAGGEFSTKNENLKRTAFEIGNIVNKIVKDFFNGTIKAYSDYSQNMSRADYNDIVNQLQDVLSFAKDKGYSIVTKDLVIADDTNKIAGMPNVLMVDENGNFYVYDVTTLRNKEGDNTEELLNRRYEGKPSNADRISAQVNMYADILVNKYGFNVNRVGVIPFNVSYEIAKKGQPVKINNVDLSSRIDFKRKQILDKTGKTSAAEVKEKVEEIKPTKEPTPTPIDTETKVIPKKVKGASGWKLRFNIKATTDQDYKAKAKKLSEWLDNYFGTTKRQEQKGDGYFAFKEGSSSSVWKHLAGGEKGESDFTIYIGSKEDAIKFAKQVEESEIKDLITIGTMGEDTLIGNIVKGRFDSKEFKYLVPNINILKKSLEEEGLSKNGEFVTQTKSGIKIVVTDGEIIYSTDGGKTFKYYKSSILSDTKNAVEVRDQIIEDIYGDDYTGNNIKAAALEGKPEEKPIEKKAEEKPKEAKPAEKEVVKEEVKTEEQETKEQLKETERLLSGDAEKNRKSGKFVKNGIEFVRNKKNKGEKGSQGQVRFTNEAGGAGVVVPFRYKIIEAETLQPSHEGGIINPLHFIPEAQPKNRKDAGSLQAEDSFAENPRFNELGENTNAYSGAPIVNERNEVIQGNNRSAGLRKGYKQGNEKYKKDLIDNAEKFGFTKEQVSKFKEPILVRETAVEDEFAIELGNYDVKDLETGGKRRIDPIAVVRRMPFDVKGKIANILFREEDKTLNQSIRDNIKDFINLINPYLNQSQRNTIFKDGELTEAGAKDLEGVVQQFLYDGGDVALPELFESLSYNQKEGIKKSLPNIFSVGYEKSIIPEIQETIIALSNFNASDVDRFNNWLNQQDMFAEGKTPKEIYTPVALELAKTLNSATSQKQIQKIFAEYAGIVKDKPADMFEEAKEGLSKKEGIKQIFKVEYEESKKISERGGAEIDKEPSAEGGEDVAEQKAKSVKSIFDEAVKLFYKIRGTEGAAKKRNLTQERKELMRENPSARFIDNNISYIFEQLEKQGVIKRKGNCP